MSAEMLVERTVHAGDPQFLRMCPPHLVECEDDAWGPICTRIRGHEGDHAAHVSAGTQIARWSSRLGDETNAPNVSPPPPGLSPERLAEIRRRLDQNHKFAVQYQSIGDAVALLSHIDALTHERGAGGVTDEEVERAARALAEVTHQDRYDNLHPTHQEELVWYATTALTAARGGA